MKYPKVLIIANNCFSLTDSNGRTVGNFFQGWPKEKLAQFSIIMNDPNWSLCDNYFCVSDKAALLSIVGKKIYGKVVQRPNITKENKFEIGKRSSIKKTAVSAFIRQMVWSIGCWKKEFNKWVEEYNPDVVLVVSGDAGFMLDLGRKVSKKRNIPLVIYNSENYYFKDKDLMHPTACHEFFYKLYIWQYRHIFREFIKQASRSIYINDALKKLYDKEFGLPSEVIYTSASIDCIEKDWNIATPRFAYLGNLGLNRHISLIEIANTLQKMDGDYELEVYGRIPNENVKKAFDECAGIKYCGMVPYEEVKNVIHSVDVVFHIESFEPHYVEDLKYAFSTKIADSLASGTNFVLYAPASLACSQYVKENECAWLITDKDKIQESLHRLINDDIERSRILNNAKKVTRNNHNGQSNVDKFQKIIVGSINC